MAMPNGSDITVATMAIRSDNSTAVHSSGVRLNTGRRDVGLTSNVEPQVLQTRQRLFTLPWRGRVGERSEPGWGDFLLQVRKLTPPRSRSLRSRERPSPSRGG